MAVRLLREDQQPQRAGARVRGARAPRGAELVIRAPLAVRRLRAGLFELGVRQRQGAGLRRSRRAPARLRGEALRGESAGRLGAGGAGAGGASSPSGPWADRGPVLAPPGLWGSFPRPLL